MKPRTLPQTGGEKGLRSLDILAPRSSEHAKAPESKQSGLSAFNSGFAMYMFLKLRLVVAKQIRAAAPAMHLSFNASP